MLRLYSSPQVFRVMKSWTDDTCSKRGGCEKRRQRLDWFHLAEDTGVVR